MRTRFERWLFSLLIQQVDVSTLQQLLANPPKDFSSYGLSYRLLCNRGLFRHYLPILEYWLNQPPFQGNCHCFGKIDFIRVLGASERAIRGWLFHSECEITSLALIVEGRRVVIHALALSRHDVAAPLGYFPHAFRSGFVGIIPGNSTTVHVGFEAILSDGRVLQGMFETVTIEGNPASENKIEELSVNESSDLQMS